MRHLPFAPLSLGIALVLGLGACTDQTPSTAPAPGEVRLQLDESRLPQPVRLLASDIDPNIAACDRFGDMVNAKWLETNPIPSDQTRWGSFQVLSERSLAQQQQIVEAAARADAARGSITQKVGDFFASGMDEAAIEAAGLASLQPMLDRIDAIGDTAQLAGHLQESYAHGLGPLFSFYGGTDIRDSNMNIAYAGQGGLSLPERSYYLEDREDYIRVRAAFLDHVAAILTLAGATPEAAAHQAQRIMALETRLAQASMDRLSLRDPANRYNPVDLAAADALTPNFSWTAFFDTIEVDAPSMFSLAQPEFFREVDTMLVELPVDDWKTWLRFRLIDSTSPYLPDAFATQNFSFYRQMLTGQQEQEERWKRVLGALNGAMGEALGQLYVATAFPPESKAKMQQLVENLSAALKIRLENLDWMGDETKARAIEKWASFTPKIGYPDVWRDWSGLAISRDSYAANALAANAFNMRYSLDRIGQPVDPNEWGMPPQMVNAYYRATANEIVFPAAILQPPFFDPHADDALNYGGIGAVIGHEMLHGYDDQGSKFDAHGNFENWWTDEDRARFNAATDKLAEQFDGYEALPGMFVNGRLGLGENIADLGGLTVAYDALKATQGANFEDPMVDGYTQDQRFFMNWATVWRIGFTEERMKVQLTVGPHAPGQFRAIGAPSNMPAFAEAFGCKDGDAMMRTGDERVTIW